MKNTSSNNSRKASQSRGERHSTVASVSIDNQSCEIIKLGVDTHLRSYSVARMFDTGNPQPTQNMTPEAFLAFVEKQKKLAKRVVVAYEAGPFGFHLCRQLMAMGVECLVVVAQNWDERNKKTKTDKIDARQIVLNLDRYLAGNKHALAIVRVPTLTEEIERDLSRERDQFRKDRNRMISRGHSLMRRYGMGPLGRWWENRVLEELHPRLLKMLDGQENREHLAKRLLSQMGDYAQMIGHLALRMKDLTRELETASSQRKTERIKGVGHLSLEKLRLEVCDWNRFQNRRQVASYTGLCPGRNESGGRSTGLSVNKCGNPRLRETLVELAWLIVRYQPDYKRLQRWKWVFTNEDKAKRPSKRKAIVALARQLAVDLWRIFTGRASAENLGLKLVG